MRAGNPWGKTPQPVYIAFQSSPSRSGSLTQLWKVLSLSSVSLSHLRRSASVSIRLHHFVPRATKQSTRLAHRTRSNGSTNTTSGLVATGSATRRWMSLGVGLAQKLPRSVRCGHALRLPLAWVFLGA